MITLIFTIMLVVGVVKSKIYSIDGSNFAKTQFGYFPIFSISNGNRSRIPVLLMHDGIYELDSNQQDPIEQLKPIDPSSIGAGMNLDMISAENLEDCPPLPRLSSGFVVRPPSQSNHIPNLPLSSKFITDVTVPDGSIFEKGSRFEKIWRFRNDSHTTWPAGCRFCKSNKENVSLSHIQALILAEPVPPGYEVDIKIPMQAPMKDKGEIKSTWRMQDQNGVEFGDYVWVKIVVVSKSKIASPSLTTSSNASAAPSTQPTNVAQGTPTNTNSNLVPAPGSMYCVALHDWQARGNNELHLQKGQNYTILDKNPVKGPSGWWLGKSQNTGAKGWFPSTYVQEI